MEDSKSDTPIALEAYEALAEAFAKFADDNEWNGHYDRPNTVALVPEVDGRQVLDAGCGPGWYSEWLLKRGAEVTALDVSPAMLAQARKRLGDRADLVWADLERPLPFVDASFDAIVSGLVLEYVHDWHSTMREFYRVLKPGGVLVFSCQHPFADFCRHTETDYYDIALVSDEWSSFGGKVTVPFYRRPLSDIIEAVIESGFRLERLLEPRPLAEIKERDPDSYAKLSKYPHFLWIRAAKG